jgi:tetratricopeptide (TPR) repeat protein
MINRTMTYRFIAIVACVAASHARADEDSTEGDLSLPTQAAQAHYEAGSVYFEVGQTQRAIVEFRAAQHDDDRPAFDYNIGLCFEKLGDAARAVDAYRRFLSRQPDSPQKQTIEQKVVELDRRVGTIVVSTRTPDAQLSLDGEVVHANQGALRVTAGTHALVAEQEGYVTRRVRLVVTGGGQVPTELTLRRFADVEREQRNRRLAIGLGTAGGIVAVGLGVGLGVGIGLARAPSPFTGNVSAIVVKP